MKFILYLFFIALLPTFCYADAGFNIGRPKAPCYAVFKGIEKLSEYEFIKTTEFEERRNNDKLLDSSNKLRDNDTLKIDYTEGRRYLRYGSVKILVRNKLTQQYVDSFNLIAEGDNLTINFTSVENNKVKYTVDKTKADYPYELFMGENVNKASVAKRNKYILISLSVIGFLTLAFMFKRRNNNLTQKPENI